MRRGQIQETRHFPALYTRDFRLFWLAQVVSLSGTWMHSAAQSWLVYSLTRSPFYLGLVASLGSLPLLLFTFWGGLIADRFRKRDILLVTQSLSIAPALIIALLSTFGVIQVWHVCVMAFLLGTINAFDIPARQSFFADLVEKKDLTNAIALNSTAFNGARITGPVIAGIVIEHLGITSCFYLNALSFVPVIIALSMIRKGCRPIGYSSKQGRGYKEVLGFIRHNKAVMNLLLLIALFSLFAIPYINLIPVIADAVFDRGVRGLSILMASVGLGSFFGALILAFMKQIKRKDLFIPISALTFCLSLVAVSLSENFYFTALAMTFSGWGVVTYLAISNGFIQERVSDGLRGRVVSFYVFVFLGLAPVGNAIVGSTADLIGTMNALRMFSALVLIVTVFFILNFRRHCEDTCH